LCGRYESYTVGKIVQEEEPEIAVVGTKGQIVIPQRLRKELAITPNTKLCVYRKDDKLVVVKLKVPPLADLKELFKEIDEQNKGKKKPTEEEILKEIQAYRREKQAKKGA
jgi:AbrB family looped-hinge helix DNA binding protein